MNHSKFNWTTDPRVAPLLASIVASTPLIVPAYNPLTSHWTVDQGFARDQHLFDPCDPRVEELTAIREEYFNRITPVWGTNADEGKRLIEWFLDLGDVQSLIADAVVAPVMERAA